MFLVPKLLEKKSEKEVAFAKTIEIIGDNYRNDFISSSIRKIAKKSMKHKQDALTCDIVYIHVGIPENIKTQIEKFGECYVSNKEGYVLSIDKETHIWGETELGIYYAVATLHQLLDFNEMSQLFLYDYPRSSFRGLKIYTPGKDQEETWKKTIDLLAYYKYNAIVLEIAGGMEYKRHPEINEEWVRYVEQLKKYSGRWRYDQAKFNYPIDPVQTNNAGGYFVTQEKMKELVAYCKERNIDVIPEVPSYSHCDYLVRAHPELREVSRAYKHPDSYCPSNPDTYKLLFDVLDEVIEVIQPTYVHIGHDELIVSGECKRCSQKDPADVFAEDVTKIHDYLAKRNIKTMFWCDAAMDTATGYGYGRPGDWDYVPARFACRDKLPKDIIMVNWHWAFGRKHEKPLLDRGYEMIYGNLFPEAFDDWKGRTDNTGVIGGVISSWVEVDMEAMRSYRVFSGLIYLAYLLWDKNFEVGRKEMLFYKAAKESFRYYNTYLEPCSDQIIEVTHTITNCKEATFLSANFYELGNYIVMYADGTTAKLPVVYGKNIYHGRLIDKSALRGICCTALEVEDENGEVYYRTFYDNPYPEKAVMGIHFLKQGAGKFDVFIKSIDFRRGGNV